MRILVHDYCGHPFQIQLSRQLAIRGHQVFHRYSQSVLSPRGALANAPDDAATLDISGLVLPTMVQRQARLQRFLQERAYGRLLANEIHSRRPDVVLSANTPLEAQSLARKAAHTVGARFIFWLQDIHGVAIEKLLSEQLGLVGTLVGRYYKLVEQRLLRQSDAVVVISDDFCRVLDEWSVPKDRIAVIPNWASTDEIPSRPRDNDWARQYGLIDRFCFLYSGTLGMKHNPELILKLAVQYRDVPSVKVMVVSEGAGADWLKARSVELGLPALSVIPFQAYDVFPDVMASADVLMAILEPSAGSFSVPSKVLSYLCAGRPLLLAVPAGNLAARIVQEADAGVVVEPSDVSAFLREAENLRVDLPRRAKMQKSALAYADRTFDIENVTNRFEAIIDPLHKRLSVATSLPV
jgi:colanic acid biosynthesis glycosyl transferase WcaI